MHLPLSHVYLHSGRNGQSFSAIPTVADSSVGNADSGTVRCYGSSTRNGSACKDPSGNVLGGVKDAAAVSNQFMTGIVNGIISQAQPSAANLSDGNTGTGAVAHATSPTFVTPALGTPASGNASNLTNIPITLTTTGSSGAATYTQSTSTLNIPQYSGGGGGGAALNPACTFSASATSCAISVSSLSVPNGDYNSIVTQCWTGASTTQTAVTITSYAYATGATNISTVTPSFSSATAAGYCTANLTSGGVNSFDARTGSVTPASGDYTAAQVTNAVDKTASNTYSGGGTQDFTADRTLREMGPILQTTTDVLANSSLTTAQNFATTFTSLGAATANTIDGVHRALILAVGWDLVQGASVSLDFTIGACSAYSGGSCSGTSSTIINHGAGAASTAHGDGASWLITATGTAGTLNINRLGRSISFGAPTYTLATGAATTSGAWTLYFSNTFGTATAGSAVCGSVTTGGNTCMWLGNVVAQYVQ